MREMQQLLADAQSPAVRSLSLAHRRLTEVPPEIRRLKHLRSLDLSDNRITNVEVLCSLKNLRSLNLGHNPLGRLPPNITTLRQLQELDLFGCGLTALPHDIGNLRSLRELILHDNPLGALPASLFDLDELEFLYIWGIGLKTLSPNVSKLTNLKTLHIGGNPLRRLPANVFRLAQLTELAAYDCELSKISKNISQLASLEVLRINDNRLTELPVEIGTLQHLQEIDVTNNVALEFPSPEIVGQGSNAVIAYLRERSEGTDVRWLSKLMIVGEGGAGKTTLLKRLRGRRPHPDEKTTHGIDVTSLTLRHPTRKRLRMYLNAWDFGGQDIYHATHQFFLSNRSLFVVVWNARLGYEQGRLYYWLETIRALAPDSPVVLVATWIDERRAVLPIAQIRRQFPQVVGSFEVSNTTGEGIPALIEALGLTAATLPLMGEPWPASWSRAAAAIASNGALYLTAQELYDVFRSAGVADISAPVLARWLHELGEILYFQHRTDLCDFVILKPQWVTKYISRVLESPNVEHTLGIFSRDEMDRLWPDLRPDLRQHFLSLMEAFDLSYRTLEDRDVSLVVELLPLDPPIYQERWDRLNAANGFSEVHMRYHLGTLPAGVPTWFIARSHRFTTRTHWRTGALFRYLTQDSDADEGGEHLGLITASQNERTVDLVVRGRFPQNFFALIKDGFELTLARFPGLMVRRTIPCPGHGNVACSNEFEYPHLLKRHEKGIRTIECTEALADVSVARLLYGWDTITRDLVLQEIERLHETVEKGTQTIVAEVGQLRELTQREFLGIFRREQDALESYCPNVFIIRPVSGTRIRRAVSGEQYELQLFCQEPGYWHPAALDGAYEINEPARWLRAVGPYLQRLIKVLQFAAPLVGPWLGVVDAANYKKSFENDVALMKELVATLPTGDLIDDPSWWADSGDANPLMPSQAAGSALRAVRALLKDIDPHETWGHLQRVLTPEGHYLWLCDWHAQAYAH